jgi:hypothetical protein
MPTERTSTLIYISARLHLRTSAEGGRMTPLKTGYRPNHVFIPSADPRGLTTYIGEIQFSNVPLLYPGDTHVVHVKFLRLPQIEKFIQVGRIWWIYEVPKLIGEAEILTIFPDIDHL